MLISKGKTLPVAWKVEVFFPNKVENWIVFSLMFEKKRILAVLSNAIPGVVTLIGNLTIDPFFMLICSNLLCVKSVTMIKSVASISKRKPEKAH